jgi:hypothetical protein
MEKKQCCSLVQGATAAIGQSTDTVNLERMVVAVEAMTSSIMQQEGHTFLTAKQS